MVSEEYKICSRAKALVKNARLFCGSHSSKPPTDLTEPCEECVMELRAQVQMLCEWPGAKWTDLNKFDSVVIRSFLIGLNDYLDDDSRQLLKPFALKNLLRGSDEVEQQRSWMAQDWATRVAAVSAMRAAGLDEQAKNLKNLKRICDAPTAKAGAAGAARAAEAAEAARAAEEARAAGAEAHKEKRLIVESAIRCLNSMIKLGEPAK